MGNENRIKIIITTDASGAVTGIRNVETAGKQLVTTTESAVSQLKSGWLAFSAGALGAFALLQKGMEYAALGAKAMQAEEAFKAVTKSANVAADEYLAAMTRVTRGTIDASDLMQKTVVGMAQDLSNVEMIQIAEMSTLVAKKRGLEVGEVFDRLTDSIANNLPRALKQMGLVTKEQFAILNQAAALGIDDIDLMRIAHGNYQIQLAKTGPVTDSAATAIQKYTAHMKNNREEIGKLIVLMAGEGLSALQRFSDAFNTAEGKRRLLQPAGAEYTSYAKKQREMDLKRASQGGAYEAPPEVVEYGGRATNLYSDQAYATVEAWQKQAQQMDMDLVASRIAKEKNKGKINQLEEAYQAFARQVENLNPLLSEEEKKLNEINSTVDKLIREGYNEKAANTVREQAKAYVGLATEIENTVFLEKMREEAERIDAGDRQKQLDLALKLVAADGQRNQMNLDYERRALAIKLRYGAITTGQAAGASFDMDVRRLEITRDQLDVEIQKRSENSQLVDGEAGLFDLLVKQQDVQKEINMLLNLRSAILKEHEGTYAEGMATGWNKYMDSIGSEFQRGEQMSQDLAKTMHSALEEFFFDPMKFSWENMWNSLRRIAAKSMADMVMDWFKAQTKMTSGGGEGGGCFGGIGDWFKGLLGFGGSGASPGYSEWHIGMEGLASGGAARKGRPYIVGERGPEIFIPGQTGSVIPNNAISGNKVANQTTNNYVTINATDAQSFTNMLRANPNAIADAFISAGRSNHPARRRR